MILDENTIIFTIRDRTEERIKTLFESARKNGITSPFLLVDFGSKEENSSKYKEICQELGISYVKTQTEGRPWSRGQALNVGIREAKTKYITTTDVDMVFDSNPYEELEKQLLKNPPNSVYYVMSYWLPKNGDKTKAVCAGKSAQGGFQFLSKSIVDQLGAYDEKIKYWGLEDCDWANRLAKTNHNIFWLEEPYRIYHRWHPIEEAGFLRSFTAEYDSMRCFYSNSFSPKLNQNYGLPLTNEDRPIFDFIKNKTPHEINFNHNDLDCFLSVKIFLESKNQNNFVKINLSPRTKKGIINLSQKFLRKIAKPLTILTGLPPSPVVNKNFDFFYASILPVLEKNHLQDYYICTNLESIYLLWKE